MTYLKKLGLIVTLIIVITTSALVWAEITRTVLVLDKQDKLQLPAKFRTTADRLPVVNHMDVRGFAQLRVAGGGQFSAQSLEKILQQLQTSSLTVVDLRQEAHGFLNGHAISWYGLHNAANQGKTNNVIARNEKNRLHSLRQLTTATVYKIIEKASGGVIRKVKLEHMPVNNVASEKALAASQQLAYVRLYVQDYHRPNNQQVDRFVAFVRRMPMDQWVYIHCRAGVGRTTTFMAMYDMMRNAKSVSFDDILARQTAIGGKDLQKLPDPSSYKYQYAVERLDFLKTFYHYCRVNQDDFQTSWSSWLSLR